MNYKFIGLKNCRSAHICGNITYVSTDFSVYILDEITTKFLSVLKNDSSYEGVRNCFKNQMNLDFNETMKLIKEILEVNKSFIGFSECANQIKITGKEGMAFPQNIQISLTNKCIHLCKHCFKNCKKQGNELSYENIVNLIEQLKEECHQIELTGGEPFLYPDIIKLVDTYDKTILFNVTTSGYLLKKFRIEDLKKFNLIQISLLGSTAALHDDFVGVKGSYEIVTSNIRWLCENNIKVIVSRTITVFEQKEIENFIILCESLGVKYILFGIVLDIGRAEHTHCSTEREEQKKIEDFLKEKAEKYSNIEIMIDNESKYFGGKSRDVFHCVGGKQRWYIEESGEIFPCTYCLRKELSMGNYIEDKLLISKLIYSNFYDKYNERIATELFRSNRKQFWNNYLNKICCNIRVPEIEK